MSSNICDKHRILKLFFIGHLCIPEFRTVSKYINFDTIWPIWEQIFPIENEYFFDQILSISIRIRIISNRTTSISVELYEYRRYLVPGAVFAISHFLCNLQMRPINQSITQCKARKACRGLTFLLIGLSINLWWKWNVVNTVPGTIFPTPHFLWNLWMHPLSQSVTKYKAGKACRGLTFWLIGLSINLWWKWNVVNTVPGTIFPTPHFLWNLWMHPLSQSVTKYKAGKACWGLIF